MPALDVDQIAEAIDRLQKHPVTVAPVLCARQRHRRSACTRCVDACPAGAIAWDEGLEVDWEACTGCGICTAACPTGALEAALPSNEELMVEIQRVVQVQDWVAFACPRARLGIGGSTACLTVGCLGRLDEGLLVSAAACGAHSMWLVDGACEGCPQAVGRAMARRALDGCNALLEAFGVPLRAAFRHDLLGALQVGGGNGSARGVSRRGLFKTLARETARLGEIRTETLQGSQSDPEPQTRIGRELPRALPSSRLLLLAGLRRLGSPAVSALASEEDGPFAQFALGGGCTGCQMCAFFCPTGALTRVVDGNRVGLAFRVSHCVNCGLCRDICYRDAAFLSPEVDLNKVVTLAVDWCFAQEMDAEPWKAGLGEEVARRILGALIK